MIRIKRLWGVALLVAVLSLAAMAPGYAGRAGIAAVTATASTEQLLVGIRAGNPLDRGTDPQHLPGVNQANQDVAATELANRGEPALSVDGQNYYKGVSAFINRHREYP